MFTIEQKEQITAYIAAIIMHADICRGRERYDEAILGRIKIDAEKLKEFLMAIDKDADNNGNNAENN